MNWIRKEEDAKQVSPEVASTYRGFFNTELAKMHGIESGDAGRMGAAMDLASKNYMGAEAKLDAITKIQASAKKLADEELKSISEAIPKIIVPYVRPAGSTTAAQRASVQGKPCAVCGATTPKQIAGHKDALVKEYYRNGSIDIDKMRSLNAIRPECPTCSNKEGAEMSRYSRQMREDLGL